MEKKKAQNGELTVSGPGSKGEDRPEGVHIKGKC
jgi:hypothetical protein